MANNELMRRLLEEASLGEDASIPQESLNPSALPIELLSDEGKEEMMNKPMSPAMEAANNYFKNKGTVADLQSASPTEAEPVLSPLAVPSKQPALAPNLKAMLSSGASVKNEPLQESDYSSATISQPLPDSTEEDSKKEGGFLGQPREKWLQFLGGMSEASDTLSNAFLARAGIQPQYKGSGQRFFEMAKDEVKKKDEMQYKDPGSRQAIALRTLLKTQFNIKDDRLENLNYNELTKVQGLIEQAEAMKGRREDAKMRREEMAFNRQLRQDTLNASKTTKINENLEKDVTDISKRVEKSGLASTADGMQQIEQMLGTDIETAKELPGYGRLESLVPSVALQGQERQIRQAVQGLANVKISSQFGASQTAGEVARFNKEMGLGVLESEASVIDGLKRIKKAMQADMQNISAGYKPEVAKIYTDRQGIAPTALRDSSKERSPSSSKPEGPAPSADQISKYAKMYNLDPEQAKQILQSRMSKGMK